MPARRKDTPETQEALQRIFALASDLDRPVWPLDGMEHTPGFTTHRHKWRPNNSPIPWKRVGGVSYYRNPEPTVWVFQRQVRIEGSTEMRDADTLVTALWDTLPKAERRRSRLFACCKDHPIRFTKKGAIADAFRHDEVAARFHREPRGLRRYDPVTPKEKVAARLRREAPPPELDPRDEFERMVAEIWHELAPQHRRTVYAEWRPSGNRAYREWALEGTSSPQAYASRKRAARRALARALGHHFAPGEYDIPTAGRTGFDYERFFDDWNF